MDKESKKVIAFTLVVACFAALAGNAFLNLGLFLDKVWQNNYITVYEEGAGEPRVDDYWKFVIKANGDLSTKVVPYDHVFECYDHSCISSTANGLMIYDSVMSLTFYNDKPYFVADIYKFCYYDVPPGASASPDWRNDYLFWAHSPTYNVTIYNKDGEVIWRGGQEWFNLDPPIAFAFYNGISTIAVAYTNAPEGVAVQVADNVIVVADRSCEAGGASYHVTAYYALEYGNHPELAYDVYCMAFGGCTPAPPQPSYPEWNIEWWFILLISVLLIILLVIL